MKCELAAALIHRPKVLFLDRPTIGLDVSMQATVRASSGRTTRQPRPPIILTSHYMEDVAELCPRVIIIDRAHCDTTAGWPRSSQVHRFSDKCGCFFSEAQPPRTSSSSTVLVLP